MSSNWLLWGVSSNLPVKVLATVGAFALGGFLGAWAFVAFVKLAFGQNVPPTMQWWIRGISGIISGCLVWAILNSGGIGLGGPGGFGLGGGPGDGKDTAGKGDPKEKKPKDKDPDPVIPVEKDKGKADGSGIGVGDSIRVEVLGDDVLRKLSREGKFDRDRRYRIPEAPEKLYTLVEIRDLIRSRRKQTVPLKRLEVIVYTDSPDPNKTQVTDLTNWAGDLEDTGTGPLIVDRSAPGRPAPLK